MSLCAKIFARHGNTLQVTSEGYETGHEPVHASSSGACVKIHAARDVWHCTNPTCGAGGGSITALMSLEGLTYDEAEAAVVAMGGIVKPRPPKIASFILNDKGKPRTIIANVLKVFQHNPRWKAALRYNVFSDEVEVCQAPPPYDPMPWPVQALTEELTIEITAWVQETYELYVPVSLVWDGLRAFAAQFPYHPVRTYLESLVWDGTPRLERWLSTYCFVEDVPYSRAAGRLTLVGAVARVMAPGCKMDTVLILEGPQGWNKSTVWRTLASDEWFTDALPDLHTKDAAQALRGKWLIEFADLDNFRRAELETIKRFLSATQDHYRPSYGRRAVTFPRHNVFMGTTNKWTYLLDETGNRRYLPARITQPCDLGALRRDRDQLWAEAMHDYTSGGRWYLDDPDLLKQATAEQDDRMEEDPWTESIHTYVETRKTKTATYKGEAVEYVTTGEILALALQIDRTHWNAGTSRRVAAVLRLGGWTHGQIDPPDTPGPRKRPKVFMRLFTSTPRQTSLGTDGTDGTDTPKSISPRQTSLGTDGTDGTDSIEIQREAEKTASRAREDDARKSREKGPCSVFPEFIKTAPVSVPSVPETLTPVTSVGCTGADAAPVSVPSVPTTGNGTDTPEPAAIVLRPTIDPGELEYIRTATRAEEVLRTFHGEPVISMDFETTHLDPLLGHIRLVQVAVPGRTVILDMHQVPAEVLRPLLTQPSRFVGHNLKFELRFLAAAGLPWPDHLTDTMHLAQLLGASADHPPKGYYTLEGVVDRELDLGLDKALQVSDWGGELSHEQLLYAARDAAAELPLFHRLTEACTKAQLDRIRALEEACLPALAWMELTGVLIDETAWQGRSERDVLELGRVETELCTLLHSAQAHGAVLPKAPEAVNWNSPKQVLAVLQALGEVDLVSTAEVVLARLSPHYPIAARLLDHRHLSQRRKNGGAQWLRQYVHPITHRVHADYAQVGTRAGRMSCRAPNMQQIPKSADYRTSVIAAPEHVLLKADYSQIELRLAALIAPEPLMLEALQAGEDLHRRTAAYVLGCEASAVTPEQRTLAKALNFGLLYGMGALRLQAQALKDYKISLTLEEATQHREAFFRLYPQLRGWHRATGALLDFEGSLDVRTLLGRRRLGITRYTEALNTPVQGAAADGFKLALARLYRHRHEVPEARLIMCVHDELVAECPRERAEQTTEWLTHHMEAAMSEVVQGQVPIEVEVQSGKDWAGTPYGV